jgi:hypothetical protein
MTANSDSSLQELRLYDKDSTELFEFKQPGVKPTVTDSTLYIFRLAQDEYICGVKALRDSKQEDYLLLFKVEFLIQRKNPEAAVTTKWIDFKEQAEEYVRFVEQDPQARRHISWT